MFGQKVDTKVGSEFAIAGITNGELIDDGGRKYYRINKNDGSSLEFDTTDGTAAADKLLVALGLKK